MSIKHPIIAVTGSSGAGTSTVQHIFERIFRRIGARAAIVHGNGFRRYRKDEVNRIFRESAAIGKPISHFGPEANLLNRLEGLFREYARTGTGCVREYIDNADMAETYQTPVGDYSPWIELSRDTDLMFYEGQHGGCIEATWSRRHMSPSHNPLVIKQRHKLNTAHDEGVDIARWVDLLIGVVPAINLEWVQKIHKECSKTGCSIDHVTKTILRRLPDYVRYITPQFSLTDINFQRVPLVDTSNPFIATTVPTADESYIVVRFREPKDIDFPFLLSKIPGSFMSRPNTLAAPGGTMDYAMELICEPLVKKLVQRKLSATGTKGVVPN